MNYIKNKLNKGNDNQRKEYYNIIRHSLVIINTNDINIEADVDLGDKNVNNNNRKSDITLKINCDMGDVEVN